MPLQAPALATRAEKEMETGIDRAQAGAGDYARMPLRALYEQVWVNVRPKDVQPGTWHREQWFWTAKILPTLGGVRIDKLDAVNWASFLANLANCGGRTKAVVQGCYRSLLRYCVEVEILPSLHSFREIKGSKTRTLARPKPLLIQEVAALLDNDDDALHRALFATAIGQGLRPGEVGSIRWEDVDFSESTLYVRGTKTDLSEDTVILTELARVELARWHEACGRPREGHVFCWGGKPIGDWRKSFQTAARKAGIADGRRVFPNLARRSFATMAAMGGVPKAATKRMLWHSHASDLVDTAFTHPQLQQVEEAMQSFPTLPSPAASNVIPMATSARKARKAS